MDRYSRDYRITYGAAQDYIHTVHGENPQRWEDFLELARYGRGLAATLDRYESTNVPVWTFPFRSGNLESDHKILPKVIETRESTLRCLDIGCGTGISTCCLAVQFLRNGWEDFEIDGIDVNPEAISIARTARYEVGKYSDGDRYEKPLEEGYFQQKETREKKEVIASPKIRQRLRFSLWNILQGPFRSEREEKYDLVMVQNLLTHFGQMGRHVILQNALNTLNPGGCLVLEDRAEGNTREYIEWRKGRWWEDYGLQELLATDDFHYLRSRFYRLEKLLSSANL